MAGLYDVENFIDIYNISKINYNNGKKKKKILKPSSPSIDQSHNPVGISHFPVRPLILLPSEVEFLLSYLAKDDVVEVLDYDSEEDRSLIEDDNHVSVQINIVYHSTYILRY